MSVNLLLVGINAKYIHTNLAIRTLKANAGECADAVEIAEYTINHRREEILSDIYKKNPNVVGFACYLWNIEYVLSVAADLKKIEPETVVFLGGPEVSYEPETVLGQHSFVDFVVVGEGEKTFAEYAKKVVESQNPAAVAMAEIDGIVYRDGDEFHRTAPREAMAMDDLVFPYDDLEGLENRILYYESIRGCPFSCSYCLSSVEKTVRMKSPERTEKELNFFLERKVPQVKFVDRTFNCNREYAYRIWKYIGEHDNGTTNFHFEISADLLREKDIEMLSRFRQGLVQFEIGVQSTNPHTVEAIRRMMNLPLLRDNVARVRENHNIHQHLDLIAGLPHEDIESFRQSFNDVYAMKPDQLQLGFLKVLTGSYMDEVKREYELRHSDYPPYEVFSTKWLSYEDVLLLKQVEEMVEVYYNSLQFTASMAYLVSFFETPFDCYKELAAYYAKGDLFARKHSRVARYEILWDFAKKYVSATDIFREILTYDIYLREYIKSPPAFVQSRSEQVKDAVRTFFDRECEKTCYLQGYDGYVTKQLFHMVYMDIFTIDMDILIQKGEVVRKEPRYLLFDYQKRNPLSHAAYVQEIPFDY